MKVIGYSNGKGVTLNGCVTHYGSTLLEENKKESIVMKLLTMPDEYNDTMPESWRVK
jgi:hypothetical protein